MNAKAKNFTGEKLRKRFKEIDERIQCNLSELHRADEVQSATDMPVSGAQIKRIIDKIGWLKREADKLAEVQAETDRTGANQISEIDLDARSMAITSRHPGVVGCSVQGEVDTAHNQPRNC